MKIDRLIGILAILLQQDKVTAPVLAEKFEVSRRTINRDIEDLCKAGIPIVTTQGKQGGISVMENYKIDRALLTSSDMQAILTGLGSLDSISETSRYRQLMDKLSAGQSTGGFRRKAEKKREERSPGRAKGKVWGNSSENSGRGSHLVAGSPSMLIDLASWSKSYISGKIELIQKAIEQGSFIAFDYFSPKGESQRKIEPYYVIFKWSSWYVYGWCGKREDFRLFKLNRMDKLKDTEELFEKREVSVPDLSNERAAPEEYHVRAVFEPECKWRLIEEFGKSSFRELPDGRLLFSFGFADKENLFSWILTFGDRAELLEPESFRRELEKIGREIQKKYTHPGIP